MGCTSRLTLVLDNGGNNLKAGLAGAPASQLSVPNCTAKLKGQIHLLIGDEVERVQNTGHLQYSRPFERGYLNRWDVEYPIWDRLFGENQLNIRPEETQLLLTEPPFTPAALADYSLQAIFEEFGFAACRKLPAAALSAHRYTSEAAKGTVHVPTAPHSTHSSGRHSPRAVSLLSSPSDSIVVQRKSACVCVIDSGFSFTHIIPFDGKAIKQGIRRINVGGKSLTNLLKEKVSYRQWNMMDEFHLMNDAKEALCYVAQDLHREMDMLRKGRSTKNRIERRFVLPDYQTTMRGYVQESQPAVDPKDPVALAAAARQQVLSIDIERFAVPEVLFRPSDIGLRQAGLAETIVQSIESCDIGIQGALYANILLTGGNVKFPGFAERLRIDLRPLVPDFYTIRIHAPCDPILYAWHGGNQLACSSEPEQCQSLSKAQYFEWGADNCQTTMSVDW